MAWKDSDGNEVHTLTTRDDGPTVHATYNAEDGTWPVAIETPDDSDMHETMNVSMNDADAAGWK